MSLVRGEEEQTGGNVSNKTEEGGSGKSKK